MIVKIEFVEHNRKYTIGVTQFLAALGVDDIDEEAIKVAAMKLISTEEVTQTDE
jgi:hypothetical protein